MPIQSSSTTYHAPTNQQPEPYSSVAEQPWADSTRQQPRNGPIHQTRSAGTNASTRSRAASKPARYGAHHSPEAHPQPSASATSASRCSPKTKPAEWESASAPLASPMASSPPTLTCRQSATLQACYTIYREFTTKVRPPSNSRISERP